MKLYMKKCIFTMELFHLTDMGKITEKHTLNIVRIHPKSFFLSIFLWAGRTFHGQRPFTLLNILWSGTACNINSGTQKQVRWKTQVLKLIAMFRAIQMYHASLYFLQWNRFFSAFVILPPPFQDIFTRFFGLMPKRKHTQLKCLTRPA